MSPRLSADELAITKPTRVIGQGGNVVVGIPSDRAREVIRPEPTALDEVHSVIAMVRAAKNVFQAQPQGIMMQQPLSIMVADLVTATNATPSETALVPEQLAELLHHSRPAHIVRRLDRLKPVAEHSKAVHKAIVQALHLDKEVPIEVTLMSERTELCNSDAITTLGAVLGFYRTTTLPRQGQDATLATHFWELVPPTYRGSLKPNERENRGLYSYGIIEFAIDLFLARNLDQKVFKFGTSQETDRGELVRAYLLRVLRDTEKADRITIVPKACGYTTEGFRVDPYRMSDEELQRKSRIPINPTPDVAALKKLLLNGDGRFSSVARELIKNHVFLLLEDFLQLIPVAEVSRQIRRQFTGVHRTFIHQDESGVTAKDAEFVIELLHGLIFEPVGKALAEAGVVYGSDDSATPPVIE